MRTREQAIRIGGVRLPDTPGHRAPNQGAYDIRALVSTEEVGCDGGIIPVSAWNLEGYRRRPLFISQHDISGLTPLNETVIGRSVAIGPEDVSGVVNGRGLVSYLRFASTSFGTEIRTLYLEGSLSDFSIRWDWRSEQLRMPTSDEQRRHGEALTWVAESVTLLEISSVVLPADPGVGVLPSVEAAFERCRSAGHRLPELEKLFVRRRGRIVTSRAETVPPEPMAAADAIDLIRKTVGEYKHWVALAGSIRQRLADGTAMLANLVVAADTIARPDGADSDDAELPPSSPAALALGQLTDATAGFDLAFRDVAPWVTAMEDALKEIAKAVNLPVAAATSQERGDFVIHLDAILAEQRRDEQKYVIDWDAIRRDQGRS